MDIAMILALLVLAVTALYFIFLGAAALFKPALAQRFLLGFADNPAVHYLELFLRLMVALALLWRAPAMLYAQLFFCFAWIVLGTTLVMLLLPWRWHRAFARRTVPYANRYVRWIGAVSLVLGVFLLAAL